MKQLYIKYGIGGYDPTKPNDNIIEQYEIDVEESELDTDVAALAEALSNLPEETLNSIKQALGIGENNV